MCIFHGSVNSGHFDSQDNKHVEIDSYANSSVLLEDKGYQRVVAQLVRLLSDILEAPEVVRCWFAESNLGRNSVTQNSRKLESIGYNYHGRIYMMKML